MNRTLPLTGPLDHNALDRAAEAKDGPTVAEAVEACKPKPDLLQIMRKIDRALAGLNDEERAIVMAYMARKR